VWPRKICSAASIAQRSWALLVPRSGNLNQKTVGKLFLSIFRLHPDGVAKWVHLGVISGGAQTPGFVRFAYWRKRLSQR
jgi:hypothetical protein